MSEISFDQDDAQSILRHFGSLEDPRCDINRHHLLGDLIVICVLAVIAGRMAPRQSTFGPRRMRIGCTSTLRCRAASLRVTRFDVC